MNDHRVFAAGSTTVRLAAVATSALLLWGCRGTLPSAPPTANPAATATPATSTADPSPVSTPTPAPSAVAATLAPSAESSGWVDAGEVPLSSRVTLVPLANGGAIALGERYDGDGNSFPAAARYTPGTTSWESIEPLNKLRSRFGAALLQDGRVLVAGGLNNADQSYSSAYTFDPEQPAAGWSKVGLLNSARTAPSMAVLRDGRVLIAGGYFHTGGEAGSVIRGTRLAAGPGIPPWETTPTRRGPRVDDVDVPPYGYPLATAELFDPTTGEWTSTGSLNYARAGAPAVTLADGRVLIVGASEDALNDVPGKAYTTAEIYDPDTGAFTVAGSLPGPDEKRLRDLGVDVRDAGLELGHPGNLVGLPDGGALLVGRSHWAKHHADVSESFRFDPADASWSMSGAPCAAVGYNDQAGPRRTPPPCLIGGFVAPLEGDGVLSAGPAHWSEYASSRSAAVYDPAADEWLEQPSLPIDFVNGEGAIGLADGTALVVGSALDSDAMVAVRFVPGR